MESKNRKADRKARRRLAALLLAGTLSSMPCVAFSAPTEVSDASGLLTALKTSQSDGILLKSTGEGGTGITLSSTLTVGMTNKVDLGGVALNQNGQKIGFSALGETLTITDSKPGEKGSALNFTSFEFDGSLHPGTVVLDGVGNQFSNGLAIQGLNVTLNNGSFAEVVGDMNVKGSSNLKILGGSGISVVKKQPETEGGTATGGNLTLTLNGGRSVMVDSADSDYRSTFTVDGKTTLSAIGESSVQALNGSGVDLGEVTLTVDAGSVMIFRADGKGTLNVGNADGTTSKQEIGSLMVMDRFTQNGTGNVLLYVQNGAELSVGGDLTLDDNTFFIKDEDAEAGAGLYVGGTLTVNQPSLVIGADSSADLEAVGANILKVAESDNTDVALTVMDKKSLTFGQVYGAQGKNSALNLTLVGGSGLHAITDEKAGKDWTGVMQLGSENSGAVNITMTEKSAIWAGKSLETTLHDGSMISLDGGSSIDAQESNSVYAASGTSYLDISGASLMYSEGTLSVRTAENANMEIFVEGISEKFNSPTVS